MSYQVSFFKNLLSSEGHLFPAAIRIPRAFGGPLSSCKTLWTLSLAAGARLLSVYAAKPPN